MLGFWEQEGEEEEGCVGVFRVLFRPLYFSYFSLGAWISPFERAKE